MQYNTQKATGCPVAFICGGRFLKTATANIYVHQEFNSKIASANAIIQIFSQ